MKRIERRIFLKIISAVAAATSVRCQAGRPAAPFGRDYLYLDSQTTGRWWLDPQGVGGLRTGTADSAARAIPQIIDLNVPRDQVVAFALYTHDARVLKLTAQFYPLFPDEPREARLEVHRNGAWRKVATAPIEYPGWTAHFRVERWDSTTTQRYRVRHGNTAALQGMIRRDPLDKTEIVVASLGCNSSTTKGPRPEIVQRLLRQDPDLLFFSGDQTYHHTEHTAGWIEFGLQYREVIKDRPTICIPDDHDVGNRNLWGEEGAPAPSRGGADGGYFLPAAYVNMVQRAQCWHLPDPVDPERVRQGINVYFTRLRVGRIDFAILEDRKFKTGPLGAIPSMGKRPDHITDERFDPSEIDRPGLQLLGERQMRFLRDWTEDWTDADIKCVLSQTALCGAAHLHGTPANRLVADLDCNGWPQSQRNGALREIRRARALHLCGDQHLGVMLKHGIHEHRDGPYAFTSPALVNTFYPRWWHPKDGRVGGNPVAGSPLAWTGDYTDGLGNRISIMAYANPENLKDENKRADGYGVVRFNKATRRVTFECWPRFSRGEQFRGWPVTVRVEDNDGRKPVAWLPELVVVGSDGVVIQVIDERGAEILYSLRVAGNRFQPPVYSHSSFTVKVGRNRPDIVSLTGLKAFASKHAAGTQTISL
jgi:hypothetical protein